MGRAHNPEVAGSNPALATEPPHLRGFFFVGRYEPATAVSGIGRSPTAIGGRAAGARLLHRDGEAVALEDGAVAAGETPLHVEADAVEEWGAT